MSMVGRVSIIKNKSGSDSKLENCWFILSIVITLFVLQSIKLTNLVLSNCKKLENTPSDSSSLAKSIPLRISTLDSLCKIWGISLKKCSLLFSFSKGNPIIYEH